MSEVSAKELPLLFIVLALFLSPAGHAEDSNGIHSYGAVPPGYRNQEAV